MHSPESQDKIESMWLDRALSGKIPVHMGVIMDGNGRWAQKRGLPRKEGHRAGVLSMRKCLPALLNLGVRYCTLFALSTENLRRPRAEIQSLFGLIVEFADSNKQDLAERGVRVIPIGRWRELPRRAVVALSGMASCTALGNKLTVQIALNYGGRQEILDAAKKYALDVVGSKMGTRDLTESEFSRYLRAEDTPDPDLILRTSGEKRLSNFLLWESAYSELIFTDVLWPDFGPVDIYKAVVEFSGRRRRFGDVM